MQAHLKQDPRLARVVSMRYVYILLPLMELRGNPILANANGIHTGGVLNEEGRNTQAD
jgi:hypothetical protein